MQFDLSEKLSQLFTQQLIDALSSQTGENVSVVKTAIQNSIAVSCHQFLHRIRRKESSLALYRLSRVAAGAHVEKEYIHLFKGSRHFQGILNISNVVFGEDFKKFSKWIAQSSGVKGETAESMLKMTTSLVMALFGEKIKSKRLAQEGFLDFMNHLEPVIMKLTQETSTFPYYLSPKKIEKKNPSSSSGIRRSSLKKPDEKPWYLSWKIKWSMMLVFTGIALLYIIIK